MTSVFSRRGVPVSFGGVRAVAGVELDIGPGELVAEHEHALPSGPAPLGAAPDKQAG